MAEGGFAITSGRFPVVKCTKIILIAWLLCLFYINFTVFH